MLQSAAHSANGFAVRFQVKILKVTFYKKACFYVVCVCQNVNLCASLVWVMGAFGLCGFSETAFTCMWLLSLYEERECECFSA